MTDPIRELCRELVEYLALLDEPPHELVCRAHAALAAAPPEPEPVGEGEGLTDGPAVPEGREPAAVVGELSDEALLNLWASSPRIDEPHGGISFARAAIAADRQRRVVPPQGEEVG